MRLGLCALAIPQRRRFMRPIFDLPLRTSLVPGYAAGSGTPTFSRASTAYVQDHEGVQRQVLANEARFWGARRVRNLFTATTALSTQGVTVGAGRITVSFTGTGSITFTGAFTGSLAGTGASNRVQQTFTTTAGTLTCTVAGSVTFAQCEDVTGQSVETMSEYVSVGVLSSPWQGANVDGVQYFDTTLAGVPIPATTLLGYLSEPAGTQLVTPTAAIRLVSDASWVKVGAPTIITTTGVDGVANACNRITATAGNTTLLQTLVAPATSRTFSVYIRRVTGTGNIELTQNGGGAWTNINGSLIAGQWVRVQLNASILDASFGVRIVTATDTIEMDFMQFEAGPGATSPMATTSASRNPDALSYPATGNINAIIGTSYCEMQPQVQANMTGGLTGVGAFPSFGSTQAYMYDGATFLNASAAYAARTSYRYACAWGSSTMSIVQNGIAVANAAFDNDIGAATFGIGSISIAGAGHTTRNVRIYNQKLTDAQLTAMVA